MIRITSPADDVDTTIPRDIINDLKKLFLFSSNENNEDDNPTEQNAAK